MSAKLIDAVAKSGRLPVSWVTAGTTPTHLNLGDALSPVIVAMMSGLPISFAAAKSNVPRLAAVGTIGHILEGGDVSFWGTGSSKFVNPEARGDRRIPYARPAGTSFTTYATRGPVSRAILAPDETRPAVFGDPLWLLPRFHEAPKQKRYELGVILHLSELEERQFDVKPMHGWERFDIPAEMKDDVVLINTVTPVSIDALRERLDLILSCKRIVSTSLHGMVFAESYGIPCLYFSPRSKKVGPGRIDLNPDADLDLRFVDLYGGLGLKRLDVWFQPRLRPTNWPRLIRAIDRNWEPKPFYADPLIEAFPLPFNPIEKGAGGSAFDDPRVKAVPTQRPPVAKVVSALQRLRKRFFG